MANGNTHVVLGDFIPGAVIDSDNDGMSDEFEKHYFGDPTAGNPAADTDGDGETNLEEYKAGTNPTDAASVLRINEIRRQGNDIVIVFEAAPDKSYRLEAGSNLIGGFPTTVQTVAATPTGGTRTVTDTGGATQPTRFYRAVLAP